MKKYKLKISLAFALGILFLIFFNSQKVYAAVEVPITDIINELPNQANITELVNGGKSVEVTQGKSYSIAIKITNGGDTVYEGNLIPNGYADDKNKSFSCIEVVDYSEPIENTIQYKLLEDTNALILKKKNPGLSDEEIKNQAKSMIKKYDSYTDDGKKAIILGNDYDDVYINALGIDISTASPEEIQQILAYASENADGKIDRVITKYLNLAKGNKIEYDEENHSIVYTPTGSSYTKSTTSTVNNNNLIKTNTTNTVKSYEGEKIPAAGINTKIIKACIVIIVMAFLIMIIYSIKNLINKKR